MFRAIGLSMFPQKLVLPALVCSKCGLMVTPRGCIAELVWMVVNAYIKQ